MNPQAADCELCTQPGGEVVHRNADYRVLLVDDANYPGFCRIIWNAHVREMTDLSATERAALMDAVWQVEEAVRAAMQPDKVNVASLGNVVPHLHWHVIPRYRDDAHFPNPIWGERRRDTPQAVLEERHARAAQLRKNLLARFGQPQL